MLTHATFNVVVNLLSSMYLNSYLICSFFSIFSRNQVTKQLPRVPPYITCNNDKF